MATLECDRPPFFVYYKAYSQDDLSDLKPKSHRVRGADNVDTTHKMYVDDGRLDIEFAVIEHYNRYRTICAILGWTGARLFSEFGRILKGSLWCIGTK